VDLVDPLHLQLLPDLLHHWSLRLPPGQLNQSDLELLLHHWSLRLPPGLSIQSDLELLLDQLNLECLENLLDLLLQLDLSRLLSQ
jgi:hypothetical protein